MDLQIAGADRRRGGEGPDLHHDAAAVRDLEIKHVIASARFRAVNGTADEGDWDRLIRIATVGGQPSFAMEVNDVDRDPGRPGRDAGATVDDDVLALEMEIGEMIHHVPVPAVSGFRAAARIDHATEAVVWRAFGL